MDILSLIGVVLGLIAIIGGAILKGSSAGALVGSAAFVIVVVGTLAAYRWFITRNEDDTVHIGDPSGLVISQQRHMSDALKKIDDIGIGLTIATPSTVGVPAATSSMTSLSLSPAAA